MCTSKANLPPFVIPSLSPSLLSPTLRIPFLPASFFSPSSHLSLSVFGPLTPTPLRSGLQGLLLPPLLLSPSPVPPSRLHLSLGDQWFSSPTIKETNASFMREKAKSIYKENAASLTSGEQQEASIKHIILGDTLSEIRSVGGRIGKSLVSLTFKCLYQLMTHMETNSLGGENRSVPN